MLLYHKSGCILHISHICRKGQYVLDCKYSMMKYEKYDQQKAIL